MHSQAQDEGHLQIGNYQLGRTVGQGTFGKVKTAIHLPTGQPVAVKIIVKDKIADVHDVERVARQLHILRIVRHPSIVQLYQIIETKRYLFIITEYLQHGELYDFIVQKGHLEEDEACIYFQQLVAGLKYMKDLGISHRDLKPQNLLLDHDHTLKIIDFGLSNTYHEGQTLKTACGSPCYAAPEMLGGKSYNGASVDIWSCGIILFAMVCGYLPFEDADTNKLYKKILAGQIYYPSRVSPQFVDLMQKLLEINPDKRISIEDLEEHPWFKLAECILPTHGIKVGSQPIKADSKVLKEMQEIGFDVNHARMSVQANRHGPDYAGYYLQLKKMRCQGYQSQHDINSVCFRHANPDSDPKESFDNTRKSYYFGVHEYSNKKTRPKQTHSVKTGKSSPYKSEVSMNRKKKVKIPQQAIYSTSSKIPKSVNNKKLKRKLQLHSQSKQKKKKQLKSSFMGDSPTKITFSRTAARRKEELSSGKKQMDRWRESKNKSCSLVQRYS